MSEPEVQERGADATSVELSMRRTGMSFQRTRMSADRTLMSIIRTSLSLISFGFTIYQVFTKMREAGAFSGAGAARNFGVALVLLGIGMLALGIIYHCCSCSSCAASAVTLVTQGLVHGKSRFPTIPDPDNRRGALVHRLHRHRRDHVARRTVWLNDALQEVTSPCRHRNLPPRKGCCSRADRRTSCRPGSG